MSFTQQQIIKQFEGYFNTPLLWENSLLGLTQFHTNIKQTPKYKGIVNDGLRLGKRVERFFSFELSLDESISILLENYQVQNDKITLGELDFLIDKSGIPIHIEVVYKFYLLDTSVGSNEIEYCIGPNRKDSLINKLNKLKNKQLPLLYNEKTTPKLEALGVDVLNIQQRTFFKAELFSPISTPHYDFKFLNKNCVKGCYFSFRNLHEFEDCKFYIPEKQNWIQNPDLKINWNTYLNIKSNLKNLQKSKISPLVWMKSPNGELQKCFITWW